MESNRINALKNFAFRERNKKNYLKALDYLHEASALEPENIKVLQETAMCYKKLGEYKKAIHLFLKIQDLKTNDKQSLNELIQLYRENSQFDKAIEVANRGLDIEPTNNHFHFALLIISLFFNPNKQECVEILQNYKLITKGDDLFRNPKTRQLFNSFIEKLNEIQNLEVEDEVLRKYISELIKYKSHQTAARLLLRLQERPNSPGWVQQFLSDKIPYSAIGQTVKNQLSIGEISEENLPQLVKSNIPKIEDKKTDVAYIFTLDITDFSKENIDGQLDCFEDLLRDFSSVEELNILKSEDVVLLLTGDGFIIAFKGEDNSLIPIKLAEFILRHKRLKKNIRIGIDYGSTYWLQLSNKARQVFGPAVNLAVRALDVNKRNTKNRDVIMVGERYYERIYKSSFLTRREDLEFKKVDDTTKNGDAITVFEMKLG